MDKKETDMNKKINKAGFSLVLLSLFAVSCTSAFASRIFLESGTGENIAQGSELKINVYVDTGGETINTLEGKFSVPDGVSVREIFSGSSVSTFWVEKPSLSDGLVSFSGVVPGGITTSKGYIFSFIANAGKTGEKTFRFTDAKVYLNDGAGTVENAAKGNLTVKVVSEGEKKTVELYDSILPELFTPLLSTSSAIFGGKYFVSFETADKDSGIDHYEIQEIKSFSPDRALWLFASSPYELRDQELSSFIYVKAVDGRGNERIAKISPINGSLVYQTVGIYAILLVFFALLATFIVRFRRRR